MMFIFEIVRENAVSGKQSEFREEYQSDKPLEVGQLYLALPGRDGAYRVTKKILEFEEEQG